MFQTWDTKFRIALYARDYTAALAIARGVRSRKDFDYVLTAQSANALNPGAEAAEYFRAVYHLARERYPSEEIFHLRALGDLASALGPCEEAVATAEAAFGTWDRIAVPLDTLDRWPKQDPSANRARHRLAQIYRQAGRPADAERVLPLAPCRHLRPLVEYLQSHGVQMTAGSEDDGRVNLFVEPVLDIDALGQRFDIGKPVEPVDYFDRKAAYSDLGFHCTAHLVWLLGTHYESLDEGDPRRLRENRFR